MKKTTLKTDARCDICGKPIPAGKTVFFEPMGEIACSPACVRESRAAVAQEIAYYTEDPY